MELADVFALPSELGVNELLLAGGSLALLLYLEQTVLGLGLQKGLIGAAGKAVTGMVTGYGLETAGLLSTEQAGLVRLISVISALYDGLNGLVSRAPMLGPIFGSPLEGALVALPDTIAGLGYSDYLDHYISGMGEMDYDPRYVNEGMNGGMGQLMQYQDLQGVGELIYDPPAPGLAGLGQANQFVPSDWKWQNDTVVNSIPSFMM